MTTGCEYFYNKFLETANKSHIKYGWDCGHSYSYLDHPIFAEAKAGLTEEAYYEFMDKCEEWLHDNDECPPCFPGGECDCNKDDYAGWLRGQLDAGDTLSQLIDWYPEETKLAMIASWSKILSA